MRRSRRTAGRLLLPTLLCGVALNLASCSIHTHTVGLGPSGIGSESARQLYILFGLMRLNEVDSQRMAEDLTSYRIVTEWSFVDILLAPLLLPFTVTSRTVTVER